MSKFDKKWSLVDDQFNNLEACRKNQPDAQTKTQFDAFVNARVNGRAEPGQPFSEIMRYDDNKATITIGGVLTPTFDFWAWLFYGNTTYAEIIQAIEEAENNEDINSIDFEIDSGGGSIMGMFDAMDAIANITVPTRAIVSSMAASAAYGLASQTDEIVATSKGAIFGSVGVVQTCYVSETVIEVTSSNAERKRPDARTEEGQAMIRDELDEIEDMFIAQIAEGRGKNVDTVTKDFGRGSTMMADRALKNGLIDRVGAISQPVVMADNDIGATEMSELTLQAFKAEHSTLYAQVIELGKAEERERVQAHLDLGDSSGNSEYALACIQDGSEPSAAVTAKHNAYAIKQMRQGALAQDDDDADPGAPVATGVETPQAQAEADDHAIADLIRNG